MWCPNNRIGFSDVCVKHAVSLYTRLAVCIDTSVGNMRKVICGMDAAETRCGLGLGLGLEYFRSVIQHITFHTPRAEFPHITQSVLQTQRIIAQNFTA